MLCPRCSTPMEHPVQKFMRLDDSNRVFQIYECPHCAMRQVFSEVIPPPVIGTHDLCDQCGRELDGKGRCINVDCSECWFF